jgi:putative membrane protein insertion efficiency factor
VAILLLAAAPMVIHDTIAPREKEISTRTALGAIRLYQNTLSPHMPVQCRFEPSCSRYGVLAIEKHGAVIGGAKTAWRIIRCNPFTEKGTVDLP